ncbi:MAG: phosphoadenosine phosphosulfate reductase family protein [Magnetococcus sp. WYHC-3]
MQLDLFDQKIDRAIRRLKENEPENEPYYGAFSGGKDSITIHRLAEMAGVKVEWYYNVTTVDPPELVRFIRHEYPHVKFNRPILTMFQLIAQKRMPPTRKIRYCCEYLKEHGGENRTVITGVRRAESKGKRSKRDAVECFSRSVGTKTIINPIIDWTTQDVWSFIREQNMKYCSLYDEGFKRLGCIGCPMAGKIGMTKEFKRWPHMKRLYIKAFGKCLENRLYCDLLTKWTSVENMFDWWINNPGKKDKKQIGLFE